MPFNCCVPLCKQRGVRDASGNKVSLFAFPSDPAVRKKWIVAIKRDDDEYFRVTKYTKVCSGHFQQSDYLPKVAGDRRFLKKEAVPSVFAFGNAERPPRKKLCRRRQVPAVQKFTVANGDVTSDALSDSATKDVAGKVASGVIADVSSNAIRDLTGHTVADVNGAVDVDATIGAVVDKASKLVQMRRFQDLQEQTASQAKLIQGLELELERCKEQLRLAGDALSNAHSALNCALSKCERFDDQERELRDTKHALFRTQRELELALARCNT
ncbi:unnamed protein product [Ixodes persulcatus]